MTTKKETRKILLIIDIDTQVENELHREWRKQLPKDRVTALWKNLVNKLVGLCAQHEQRVFVFLPGRTTLPSFLGSYVEKGLSNTFVKKAIGEMSGFHASRNDSLPLLNYLIALKPTELHVAGAYTDACVLATVKDDRIAQVVTRENVVVHFDASLSQSTDAIALSKMLETYNQSGVKVVTS